MTAKQLSTLSLGDTEITTSQSHHKNSVYEDNQISLLLTSDDTQVPSRATAPVVAARDKARHGTVLADRGVHQSQRILLRIPTASLRPSRDWPAKRNSLPTVPSSSQHAEDEDGVGCPCCKACQVGNLTLD